MLKCHYQKLPTCSFQKQTKLKKSQNSKRNVLVEKPFSVPFSQNSYTKIVII